MNRIAVWAACLGLVACRKEPPPPEATETRSAPPKAATSAAPADHLAKGELVAGKEKAFALVLPRDLKLAWSFPDVALARGDVEPELVANYVRARVGGGTVTIGASQTLFEGVRVAAEPGKDLRIKVEKVHGLCHLEIRDITPPPADPDPGDDVARWRKAGFAPNGKPLDPLRMK